MSRARTQHASSVRRRCRCCMLVASAHARAPLPVISSLWLTVSLLETESLTCDSLCSGQNDRETRRSLACDDILHRTRNFSLTLGKIAVSLEIFTVGEHLVTIPPCGTV